MREIQLTRGLVALVDDSEYERVIRHRWYAQWHPGTRSYRARMSGRPRVFMHRYVLELTQPYVVDHRNHNTLDNRRQNLRPCSAAENNRNRRKRDGLTSRYKGVYYERDRARWKAHIDIDGRTKTLGRFTSEEDAARAYDAMARQLFGEFAYLNFPSSGTPSHEAR